MASEIRRQGTGGMIRSESRGRRGGGGSEICPRSRVQRERNSRAAGRLNKKRETRPFFLARALVWFFVGAKVAAKILLVL